MNPHISFITIGVKDLQKMKVFYQDILGWETAREEGDIVFFKMNPELIFALYPEKELAEDIGTTNTTGSYKNMSLAMNVSSEKAVDDFFSILIDKKVTIQKMPEPVFWGGYRGYFADPENNFWEVAYNPFL